jgi:hypothetical protein
MRKIAINLHRSTSAQHENLIIVVAQSIIGNSDACKHFKTCLLLSNFYFRGEL